MRAEKVTAEIFRHAFGHSVDRQAGCIRGYNRSRLAVAFDAPVEIALDLQLFNDGFDDPIHARQLFKVVLEIAGRYQTDDGRRIEGGGLNLLGRFKPGIDDAIAHGGARKRQPFRLLLRR